MGDQTIAILRGQLFDIGLGTAFVFLGLVSCAVAAMRRRRTSLIFVLLGAWSIIYGVRMLFFCPPVREALPGWLRVTVPYVTRLVDYTLLILGGASSRLLTVRWLRKLFTFVTCAAGAIAIVGYPVFVAHRSDHIFNVANSLLAAFALSVLVVVVFSPRLYRSLLVLGNSGILRVGAIVFFVAALAENVSTVFERPLPHSVGDVSFAIYLLTLGLYAMQVGIANQHRLAVIESELEVARHIQSSILPTTVPKLRNVQIAAAYQPMTAVAGDFYDFIPVDEHRAGFLVADVCGHGVPAALVASMLKMAVQSVAPRAHDPAEVLRGLNRMLYGSSPGTLVSAAYLWLDVQAGKARYAAAGHPPMLMSRDGAFEQVECNGLLFGVTPDSDYPVHEFAITPGDRLLLYTDGLTEPENAAGEAFGDRRLQQVIGGSSRISAVEVPKRLLHALRNWNQASTGQQDDITIVVVDVVAAATAVSAAPAYA